MDCVREMKRISNARWREKKRAEALKKLSIPDDDLEPIIVPPTDTVMVVLRSLDPRSAVYPKTIVINNNYALWWEIFGWTGTVQGNNIMITDCKGLTSVYSSKKLISVLHEM